MNDLRFALRMLRKQPVFSAIAVLTLALGIGATSAVFSLVQGVLLTPPPYRQPDRLVSIDSAYADGRPARETQGWSAAQWLEWQREVKSLRSIAAYSWSFSFWIRDEGSQSLEGMRVTSDYFQVTGLQPFLGRTFLAAEAAPNAGPVIILGYDLWQQKFNGDPNIVGKTIRMSRRRSPLVKIIGIMPPGIRFLPSPGASQEPNYNLNGLVDFWLPAAPDPAHLKDGGWNLVGRLQDGATLQQAQQELAAMARRQGQNDLELARFTPLLRSLTVEMNREGQRILYPLLAAAALVLFIACGNAAALMLVRGLQRQQEYAVRSALGIPRFALFRQVSAESLLVAFIGGACGIFFAIVIVKVFKVIGIYAIPRLDAVHAGWPVLLCGLACAGIAALLAGLVPALRASGLDPADVLKSAGPKTSAGPAERRLLRLVTMAQTALTLALLVGAGLLIRTMLNLASVQPGYDTTHILSMTVTAVQGDWAVFHQRALDAVAALPGVRDAAFAWGVPLSGNSWPGVIEIEGQPPAIHPGDGVPTPLRSVTQGYFNLLGQKMIDGRDFRSTDGRNATPVAIVNRAFVNRYFPNAGAIGRKIWFDGRSKQATLIIGVSADGRTAGLTRTAEPEVYLPLWQASAFSKDLVVRSKGDPRLLVNSVQRAIHSVDPTAAIENVKTLEEIRANSIAARTFAMRLLVGFSAVGTILSLVGIYGILSLSVASRRRELAIRCAVGADRAHIRRLVFGEGFRLIAGGVVAGLALALLFSRFLSAFLFEVNPYDPATLTAVGLLFTGVALLACWAPGRRASNVDPMEALRCE